MPTTTTTLPSEQAASSQSTSSSPHPQGEHSVILIELFAGIASTSIALEQLQIPTGKVLPLLVECDDALSKVLAIKFPRARHMRCVLQLLDKNYLLLEDFAKAATAANPSALVLVTAGFPCQDLSSAKISKSMGLLGKRSCLFAAVVLVLSKLRTCLPDKKILFIVENVASMEPKWRRLLDKTFGVPSKTFDASASCAATRRRLVWTNIIQDEPLPKAKVDSSAVLDEGWTTASGVGLLHDSRGDSHRWDCFLRPFGPGSPPEFPSDFTHLGPMAYHAANLAFKKDISTIDLALVLDKLEAADSLRQGRDFNVPARCALIEWIHKGGGDRLVRPLHGRERARALTYPESAASASDTAPLPFSDLDWRESAAFGNSFPLPVIRHILSPLAAHLQQGSPLPLLPVLANDTSWAAVFAHLGLEAPKMPPSMG